MCWLERYGALVWFGTPIVGTHALYSCSSYLSRFPRIPNQSPATQPHTTRSPHSQFVFVQILLPLAIRQQHDLQLTGRRLQTIQCDPHRLESARLADVGGGCIEVTVADDGLRPFGGCAELFEGGCAVTAVCVCVWIWVALLWYCVEGVLLVSGGWR